VGALSVAKSTYGMLGSINRHFFRGTYNMHQRYAKKDSWVLVTLDTDSKGPGISKLMAAEGFNVCMVARDGKQMDDVITKINA